MQRRWKFDENNPYQDSFEEALLKIVSSPAVFDMIRRKCADIQRAPTQNPFGYYGGKLVYIAKTGPVNFAGIEVDPLLIMYTLKLREGLIQRVYVCRAADLVEENATSDQMSRALRPAIERALSKTNSVGTSAPSGPSNLDRRRWLEHRVREFDGAVRERHAEYYGYVSDIVRTGDSAAVIPDGAWEAATDEDRRTLLIPYYHCLRAELIDLRRRSDQDPRLLAHRWERVLLAREVLHEAARSILDLLARSGTMFDDEVPE
ncbi:MAG TPA: hypothetical protein VFO89_05920 [Thermoanaerobaculia bacterium]|nr:hypothetical protein [Thermoanaerobaculia bacterium]